MKNHIITFQHILFIFGLISYFYIGCNYALSIEIGWNESFRLFQSQLSISNYFDLFYRPYEWLIAPDRGPAEWLLVNFFSWVTTDSIPLMRVLFFSFNLLTLISVYFFLCTKGSKLIALGSTFLLAVNIDFYFKTNLISIYGFNTFFTVLFIISHSLFSNSKRSNILHSILSLVCITSLFTSLLPIILSFYLLLKKYRRKLSIHWYFYIPTIFYAVFKGIIIFRYRFVDRVTSSNLYIYEIKNIFFEINNFFNVYPNEYTGISLIFLCIYFLFSINLILNPAKQRSEIYKFTNLYLITFLFTYFAMKAWGAEEIVTRYYFPILPFFWYIFFKGIPDKKNLILIVVLVAMALNIKTLSKSNVPIKVPLLTAYGKIVDKIGDNDLVCMPQYPSRISHLERVHLYLSKSTTRLNQYLCYDLDNPDKLSQYDTIFVITWGKQYSIDTECTEREERFCLKKFFKDEISRRKLKNIIYEGKENYNRSLYISEFIKN